MLRCGCILLPKAVPGGALLQLLRPHERGQRSGHGGQLVRKGSAPLFLIFERIPAIYTGVFRCGGRKDVGVPEHQLFADVAAHILKGKASPLFFHGGVEHHLHQHVSQFLPEQNGVICVNGLQRLAGLFQKVFADGRMGLHLIPRAAIFRVPQDADHLQQLLRRIGRLRVPVQHTFHLLLKRYCKLYRSCCGFSSKKPQFSSIFHGFLRFSQKQDGVLWGIPPCCSFFRLPAYSCAPHLLQNSASSETGAPHCGQVLRAGWAGCSGAASSASSMGAS